MWNLINSSEKQTGQLKSTKDPSNDFANIIVNKHNKMFNIIRN